MAGITKQSLVLTWILAVATCHAQLRLNEVSDKGTPGTCGNNDWVEIVNTGTESVSTVGYEVCGTKCNKPGDVNSTTSDTIAPGAFVVLCRKTDFHFGIGGREELKLKDSSGATVDNTTLGGDGRYGQTWARDGAGQWVYTLNPTPGAAFAGVDGTAPAQSKLRISEVSDKGTNGTCVGSDWIEITNSGSEAETLDGIKICDRNDCRTPSAFTGVLAPGAFLLLCGDVDFKFGLADKDEVELKYAAGGTIDSTKLGAEGALDKTWARDNNGLFGYTTMPTPGAAYAGPGTTTGQPALSTLRISEISDKGTTGTCDGKDWIEITNSGSEAETLDGIKICDTNACKRPPAFTGVLAPGAYLLLCGGTDFNFGISGKDEVELRYAAGGIIDSTKLGGEGALDKTWARDSNGLFGYTTMPTPGAANAELGATATTTKLPGITQTTTSRTQTTIRSDDVSAVSGQDSNIGIVLPTLVLAIALLADRGC